MSITDFATGERLRTARQHHKLSIDEATILANETRARLASPIPAFSRHSMRRFENIGISERYGKTPPTLEQLRVLLHTYSASPGWLLLGVQPAIFPLHEFTSHKRLFFNDDMVFLMNVVGNWSADKRQRYMQHFREFYC